jgi:hypothetical protein
MELGAGVSPLPPELSDFWHATRAAEATRDWMKRRREIILFEGASLPAKGFE